MRKSFFVLAMVIGVSLMAESPYLDAPREYSGPVDMPCTSFFYTVDIPKLREKCAAVTPEWMMQRLQKEMAHFRKNKISQQALDVTFEKFSRNVGSQESARYRVIGERIYRHGQDPWGMDAFFRTIARVADFPGIPDLPNVDFIISHNDVTPFDFQSRDFWITENFQDQAPIFTYARKENCPYLVSIPDRFTIAEWWRLAEAILEANSRYPWSRKKKSAFWRGQPSDFARLGMWPTPYEEVARRYAEMPRYKICLLSNQYPGLVDAGFNQPGFSATSEVIEFIKPFNKDGCSPGQHLQWAYLPTLDGFTSTYPGFLWRLLSNSVAFKQESEESQWFYDALIPYEHYVPIKNNMEDLIEKILWAQQHEEECKRIAANASALVRQHLMIEDIYLYFFRVLQEYATHQDFDTLRLLNETEGNPNWVRLR
ncbi:MAG: hypothetical protein KGZ39_07400 [Simkania sp.]|nr:hypothetical protein [Simkania sp.]